MNKPQFALASWQKKSPKTDDLRQDERAPVSGWQASLFTDAVLTLESEVVDTSAHGAGLIIPTPEAAVLPDMELTLSLDTGHKKLTRKAKVRWLQKTDSGVRLGVEFVDHVQIVPGDHHLDIKAVRVDPACAMRIPATIAVRRKVLPFIEMEKKVHVASHNLKNQTLLHSLERMLKAPIVVWDVDEHDLEVVLKKVYGTELAPP